MDLVGALIRAHGLEVCEVAHDRGPVMVTIEYRVEPIQAEAFVATLDELSHERRRDGAYAWGLFEDVAQPGRYLEYFLVASWLEHLRQHERVTRADQDIQTRALSFHAGPDQPRVSHFLAPGGREPGKTAIVATNL